MIVLYRFGLLVYALALSLAAPFHPKAALWKRGRKDWRKRYAFNKGSNQNTLWFHCSSLGEFEQGRPLLEACRAKWPEKKIVLTFFSPSGYEVRKNYPVADQVCYLPLDSPANARDFIDLLQPEMVFFIKYEFWLFYLRELEKRHIPVYLVSAIFRANQIFFKPWGALFRKQLKSYERIFVQDEASVSRLNELGIKRVLLSGDTRFDRVLQLAVKQPDYPWVSHFSAHSPVLVAGSTWPADEEIIRHLLVQIPELRCILAPHETDPANLSRLKDFFPSLSTLSELESGISSSQQVVLIDRIGLLSTLYPFGKYAYVGGGFGSGIHNILEAAVWARPVFIGPNYQRFKEAVDLTDMGAALVVRSQEEALEKLKMLEFNPEEYQKRSALSAGYVRRNAGATERIMSSLSESPVSST